MNNSSKTKKDDYQDGNEGESKLISDNYQNKIHILTRIKKPGNSGEGEEIPKKESQNERKSELSDFVTKKIKLETSETVIKQQRKQNVEENNVHSNQV